jgi:hypothetical protein
MTEEEVAAKSARTKVKVVNFAKLAGAIVALTTAVTGYVQVRRDQNTMLEAIATKVNDLTLKVAYLEGRLDGLSHQDAADLAQSKAAAPQASPLPEVKPAEPPPPAGVEEAAKPLDTGEFDKRLYRPMPKDFQQLQAQVDRQDKKL